MGIVETIKELLRQDGEQKARQLANKLSKKFDRTVTKSEVNAVLYSYENVYFSMSADYKWSLLDSEK